jgi:hypothetical protein
MYNSACILFCHRNVCRSVRTTDKNISQEYGDKIMNLSDNFWNFLGNNPWNAYFLIFGSLFVIMTYFVFKKIRRRKRIYYSFPTATQYMARQGQGNKNGIRCYACGSQEIWRYPVANGVGSRKIGYLHQSHQCGTYLYRT